MQMINTSISMKYCVTIFLALFLFSFAQASLVTSVSLPPDSATSLKTGLTISELSKMSFKEFRQLTGNQGKLKDRMAFLMLKKEIKKQVKLGNGSQQVAPMIHDMMSDSRFKFKIWGFLAGLLLGLLGVALVYIISRDKHVHTSAWIGLGVLVIVALVSIFSIFPA